VAVSVIALALGAAGAAAQTPQARPLSLEEALRLSSSTSEQVEIARAGITRARGSLLQARSAALPQLNGSASYSRALASQFEGIGGGGPDSTVTPPFCVGDFSPDPSLPLEQRLQRAEQRLSCPPGGGFGGIDFSNIGFGAENTYNLGLNFNWSVFNGGRNQALTRVARAGREVAEIGLGSAEAQNQLDVTQAYFDARLSDQLLQIAEATLAQAEETLRLTELGARVGQQAEFDVLRARVARDNQRPAVIQRRAARDLAYDRLRTLLDIPQGQPLELTTPLDGGTPPVAAPDTTAGGRAPVRQAEQQVAVQRAQLAIARSQRLPSVSLTSQYGQVAFARNLFPELDSFRDNWTVGAALQIPVFTGGRVRGEVLSAEANVNEARAQLEQVRELAELDTRSAYSQLEAARATWEASSGTVEQAERAYQIAEIRFREGISTQLELTDARILLEQSRTNRASAARDLQVAQARVALLPYLPLSGAGGQGQGAQSGFGASQTGAGAGQQTQTQGGAQGAQGGAGAQQGTGGIPGQGFP
jgi:outer membrane protein TolC